jgi:hypothetical protein
MADSVRQKIVDAVITRMAAINGSGSYVTALGTMISDSGSTVPSVADSRTVWDESELPAISVFDGDNIAAGKTDSIPLSIVHMMPILVRGFLPQNVLDAKNARKLIKDIYTAIRVDDQFGKIIMQSNEIKDAITRNEHSFEVEACEVEFECQFITDSFNAEAR